MFITCFAGLIALLAPPAVAQRPLTPEETRALDSLRRIRDSIAYARELATADSIVPSIPTDSLRALYRAVATGADPIAAIKAIPCEAYRLWHKYGYPADVAEQRIREKEWTEEHDASIRRAFDTLYHAGPYHTGLTSALPTRASCGVADGAPPARAWAPVDPRTFDRFLSRGLSRDSLRLGPTYFEGAASIRHDGQDSTVEFAGRANIQFTSEMFLELRLNDWTRKNDITGFYFRRSGPQLLRAGTYPIVGNADFFETRPDANIFMYYGQSEVLRGHFGRYPRIRGTVTLDRADTSGAAGHLEFWVEADDPPPGWWQRNIASFRWLQQSAGAPLADELHVRATFRARYDNGDEQLSRAVSHFPLFPRRLEHSDPAPDTALIARHFFLDEREPCEKLPVYSRESVLSSLPPTYPGVSARARLNIVTDSTGRARGGMLVMAIEDTSLAGTFGLQTGLRFEKTAPDQLIGRVRCTLTLRKEH